MNDIVVKITRWLCSAVMLLLTFSCASKRDVQDTEIKVVAFYTARHDPAHISFVGEANHWFSKMASLHQFTYDSTSAWSNLNETFLSQYDVVIFLDTRPEDSLQRVAFQQYMERGGGWLGFHFAAFALTPSAYPQNWNWYHEEFLGSGEYKSNTWRPTPAILRVDDAGHPLTKDIDTLMVTAPNEWYSWKNDLAANPDIQVLLSIDTSSFPLGTGPKPHEIWHNGYYPVVWTNKKYRMVYFNMGHNDMDYEGGTNRPLSSTFTSDAQNKLVIDALKWVGRK